MTSFILKIIAIVTMTIDHLAKIVGQVGFIELFPNMPLKTSYMILNLMCAVGRMAFPLFAFMIAEGAMRTRSRPKYFARLLLFAAISEPFYYYAFNRPIASVDGFFKSLSRLNFTNVFFTLALSVCAIMVYEKLKELRPKQALLIFLPIFAAFTLLAEYVHSDYGMMGILLIVGLYLAPKPSLKAAVIVTWSVCAYILRQAFVGYGFMWSQVSIYSVLNCLFAMLPCILILLYNGKRGRPLKWLFYIYYPAHLLVFSIISALM